MFTSSINSYGSTFNKFLTLNYEKYPNICTLTLRVRMFEHLWFLIYGINFDIVTSAC